MSRVLLSRYREIVCHVCSSVSVCVGAQSTGKQTETEALNCASPLSVLSTPLDPDESGVSGIPRHKATRHPTDRQRRTAR